MDTLAQVYKTMFDAVKADDIEVIIKAAYSILKHPVIITDTKYVKLTEVYPAEPQGDTKWDIYLNKIELNAESVKHIFDNSEIDAMFSTYSPVLMNTGYFSDSIRLTAPVINRKLLVGYVSMYCGDYICTDQDKENIQIVADSVSMYFSAHYENNYDSINLRNIFSEKIIHGKLLERDELSHWIDITGINPTERFVMMIMQYNQDKDSHTGHYITSCIYDLNIPILWYQSDKYAYGMFYGLKSQVELKQYLEMIRGLIRSYNFNCGLSRSFTSLAQVKQYTRQSEIALFTGILLNEKSDKTFYFYRDITIIAILDAIKDSLGNENAIHPTISLLEWVDATRQTDYLNTLKEYVFSSFDSAQTCQILNIHRNTLNYRLNKIEEMARIDLHDFETRLHLAISFKLME